MLSGPSPRGDYDRQISNMVCHTVSGNTSADRPPCGNGCGDRRGCSDCYEKPPAESGSGGGRGCSDCYEKAPSGDDGDGGRGCGDCYRKPSCEDRCEKAPCDTRDGRGDGREVCERNRPREDCGCDDREEHGSFLHRLLGHIFDGGRRDT
jgi:hypothetical protein